MDLIYDAEGNRVGKTVSATGQPTKSTTYLIDSASASGWPQCVEEFLTQPGTTNQAQRTIYQYGPHGPISQQTTGSPEVDFLLDAHGSVRGLIDTSNGQTLDAADYEAYGIPLSAAGSIATTSGLGYNGEYYDADLGLIYLRARFYDPTTGRFLNRDPYQGAFEDPQSLHAYHFTGNDPVNGIDPSGNFSLVEVLHTQALIRTLNYAQRIQKLEDTVDPAIKAIGSLWVLLNYAASWESLYLHQMGGVSTPKGNAKQWLRQGVALFKAGPYNFSLLKEFRSAINKNNKAEFAERLIHFGRLTAKVAGSIERLGLTSEVHQKINGLPEFTPHAVNGLSIFIRGAWGKGLSGYHGKDVTAAQTLTRTKLTGAHGRWHHHEVMGIMQFIDPSVHRHAHEGGRKFWSLMKNKNYQ